MLSLNPLAANRAPLPHWKAATEGDIAAKPSPDLTGAMVVWFMPGKWPDLAHLCDCCASGVTAKFEHLPSGFATFVTVVARL